MTDNYEYREVELELRDADERIVSGIMVPFGEVATARDVHGQIIQERFEHGSVDTGRDIYLYQQHDHTSGGFPVGRVTEMEVREDGVYFSATFDNTDKGDAAYSDAKARRFKGFSVGFEPISQRVEDGIIVREKVAVREVSLVPQGAYKTAELLEVRNDSDSLGKEDNNESMEENKLEETVNELTEKFTDLERRMAVNEDKGGHSPATTTPRFASVGEVLKGAVNGDNNVELEVRAYTGATTADTANVPMWANETLKLVEENRPLFNRFNKGEAPSGMSVNYPKVSSTSGTVAEQAAQGDDLGYLEVVVNTGSVTVKTYGGYSQLSRQLIELGSVDHLNVTVRYQAFQYAKATESAVRTALAGATGTSTATLTADTAIGWTKLVREAGRQMRLAPGNPAPQFIVVSSDVMDMIADKVDSTGRPLFAINADAVNSFGTQDVLNADAVLGKLPVFEDVNLAADSCYVANQEALTTYESAGAPVRLAAENIINLSKDFSLYGYLGVGVTNPKSIVKCDVDLA